MRLLLGLVALLTLAIPAQAQSCDLTPSAPCSIPVDTDTPGVYFGDHSTTTYNVTQGDSHVFEVWNWFDEAHIFELQGHDLTFTVAAFDDGPTTMSPAVTFDQAGTFALRDTTSGMEATILVAANDIVDVEAGQAPDTGTDASQSASSEGNDAPGPAFTLLLAALLLAAARRR